MGRLLTWCLVAAVAGLGLAAGIDAIRGGGKPEPTGVAEPERTTTIEPGEGPEDVFAEARSDLLAAGLPEGRLTYADEDCRNHVVTLPALREPGPRGGSPGLCRYRATVGGLVGTVGPERSPDRSARVGCQSGLLTVLSQAFGIAAPELLARERGCAAAWKPNGTATFIRGGAVRRLARCPGDGGGAPLGCSRPVLTRTQLARQLRGVPWSGYVLGIEEVHWLDNRRFAAIMRARSPDGRSDYLVILDHGRLVEEPTFAYANLRGIRPSPSGRFVSAHDDGGGGIVVVNGAGESVQLAMDHGDAVAWSPDEQWIAEATDDGIYVFRADEDSPEFIQIPVVARDLLWE